MAVLQRESPEGRNFTADELIGRQIRIEGTMPKRGMPPTGHDMMVFADGEVVSNACRLELSIEPDAVVEAKVTLYRFDPVTKEELHPPEVVVLRNNIEVSFSAIASEVH